MPERTGDSVRAHSLSRSKIISAALKMVDEEGLNALSFRSLGKRLGVSQTAFYRHVPDKAALLDGVSEEIWREVLEGFPGKTTNKDGTAVGWREIMRDYARALHDALLAHPNAVELVLTHPISTPGQFSLIAKALSAFDSAQLVHPDDMLALITVVTVYTTGFSAAEVAPPAGGEAGRPSSGFDEALPLMARDDRQALEALVGQVMIGQWNLSEQFEVGLEAMLGGWGNRRNAAARSPEGISERAGACG